MKKRYPSPLSLSRRPFLVLPLVGSFLAGYLASESTHLFEAPLPVALIETNTIRVCFSPKGGCEARIIQEIQSAQKEILVQAYVLTSFPLAEALIDAKERGVRVQILCDKSQVNERSSQLKKLLRAGLEVQIDRVPGIAHNKAMIIDEETTLTGSYNFTQSANTRNAENLLFIKNKELSRIYKENWIHRARTSQPI